MGTPEPASFESLEHLGHGLVAQIRRRLQLLAVELTEEEIRFSRLLGWQLFALFLTCLTITLAVMLVIAAVWEGPARVATIGALLLVVAVGAGATGWLYRERVRGRPLVFSQTLEELRRDEQALDPRRAADFESAP